MNLRDRTRLRSSRRGSFNVEHHLDGDEPFFVIEQNCKEVMVLTPDQARSLLEALDTGWDRYCKGEYGP